MPLVSNQDVGVKEQKPKVMLTQILIVPDFVEKYLDIDTRLRLRKTCKTIREIINEKLLHIDGLNYNFIGNCIDISTNEDFKVLYKIIEGGLRVRYWDREKVINTNNDEEKVEIIQQDLMSILCNEKLRIDTLRIESNLTTSFNKKPPIGMRALRNTFIQVPNKRNVRNLEYFVYEVNEAFIVTLNTIDPVHLKFLYLSMQFLNYSPGFWEDLNNLEQWKLLKSLIVRCPQLTVSDITRFFTHFENAHLKIRSFYGLLDFTLIHNSVMELKNKLLQNFNLKQLKIRVDMEIRDSDFENIKASLQQYNTNNTPYPFWFSIPYPDSDKKLELLVETKMIWFKGPCYVEGEEDTEEEEVEDEMLPLIPLNFNDF
ncbi:hypothetical protein GCK72_011400 [Caenorhabditis remanei]|uniref:Uncharacterized protein n=1 Tax=Caenorhabditis remanei TaxID=31234 RepID=A0A6A5H8L2_CAERE|nr:hypothetical protein GCK72_011400 [Caenorhabditis remanei]KAF1763134.1 hypothetical protein GCK72_011400 [Caenorhabditis remanei]